MLFSIITICFNSERTIERTIKSVLVQTFKDYEYIIVDGGSKDLTLDIVKKYEPLFEGRMKWKSEPDRGIYDAMNKGIMQSSGTIIGIVNSDDWLEPDALCLVEDCYRNNDSKYMSICCGWMNFYYDNGAIQVLKTDEKLMKSMAKVYEMGGIRHPATFVPKSLYEKIGLFDISIRIMADTDLILRFVENDVNFIFPNRIITNMSDGGASNLGLMKACRDYSIILKKRNVVGGKYLLLYYKGCTKRYIKGLLPIRIIEIIRDIKKS